MNIPDEPHGGAAQTLQRMCSGDRRAKSSAWRRPLRSSSPRYPELCAFQMGVVDPWRSRLVSAVSAAFPSKNSDIVVLFAGGGLIHVRCWPVSDSETSRQSRDRMRRSRKWIDDSRPRLDDLHSLADRRIGEPRPTMLRAVTAPPSRR
jgi:hypothetical protein